MSSNGIAALATLVALGAIARLVMACDTGPEILTGVGEPMRVSNGQFIEGSLPGSPPPADAGVATSSGDGSLPPLSVLSTSYSTRQLSPGQTAKFGGDITDDAIAVGASLQGLGTGYWVVPASTPDISIPGTFTYSLSTSFNRDDPGGLRNLLVVAIGPSGKGGTQFATQLCFESRIPDNQHSCYPDMAPPAAVFTLQWDTNFDLDLHVRAPDGTDFSPKQPYGGPTDAGPRTLPTLPHIDRDSLGSCVPDGLNQEDLIFPSPPPRGTYTVYADPFASCGQPTVRFKFTLYRVSGACPDCNLAAVTSVNGELLASQETGGTLEPLQIAKVSF